MTDPKPALQRSRTWMALILAAGSLALTACGDKGANETAGQKVDSAVANTQEAAVDAKAKAEQMTSEAKAKTESAAASTESTVKQEATDAKEAVKDAGSAVAQAMGDAAITASVSTGLAKDADLSAIKIDVDTKDGKVTLSGPAPNAAAKERAEAIAKTVEGVKSVDNKLEVKAM